MNKEFIQNTKSISITIKSIPVEAYSSIGIIEQYHHPLHCAYEILTKELENDNLTKSIILQIIMKAVNNTIELNRLIPTLLVYKTYPKLSNINPLIPTIIQYTKATKKAITKVHHIQAKKQIIEALKIRNGLSTILILTLPLNLQILILKKNKGSNISGKWIGPHTLIRIDREIYKIELISGLTKFRSTSV